MGFFIYFANLSESIGVTSAIVAIILLIIFLVGLAIKVSMRDDKDDPIHEFNLRKVFMWMVLSFIVSIVLPDKQTLIEMYVIPKVLQIKDINKLPDNLVSYLNKLLVDKDK